MRNIAITALVLSTIMVGHVYAAEQCRTGKLPDNALNTTEIHDLFAGSQITGTLHRKNGSRATWVAVHGIDGRITAYIGGPQHTAYGTWSAENNLIRVTWDTKNWVSGCWSVAPTGRGTYDVIWTTREGPGPVTVSDATIVPASD